MPPSGKSSDPDAASEMGHRPPAGELRSGRRPPGTDRSSVGRQDRLKHTHATAARYGASPTARQHTPVDAEPGLASASSLQVIVGTPAAPTNVKAVSGSTTIATGPLTVTFTPGANNGAAITSDTATCTSTNAGVTGMTTGAGSPLTVTGLTTTKTYTCTVTATNARGMGLASAPSATIVA